MMQSKKSLYSYQFLQRFAVLDYHELISSSLYKIASAYTTSKARRIYGLSSKPLIIHWVYAAWVRRRLLSLAELLDRYNL